MQALELEVGNTKVGQFRVAVDKNKLPSADMYYYASEAYRNWCHGQPHCWMISDALRITCTTWVLVESGREVLLTQSYLGYGGRNRVPACPGRQASGQEPGDLG